MASKKFSVASLNVFVKMLTGLPRTLESLSQSFVQTFPSLHDGSPSGFVSPPLHYFILKTSAVPVCAVCITVRM